MVKFYNPFKWHLIKYDGYYYVRKLSFALFWWDYADSVMPKDFTWSGMSRDARIFSIHSAMEVLVTKRKPLKVEVIHGSPD